MMQKKYYLFRNATVERFFTAFNASYSGYNDLSSVPDDVDCYVWFYLSPIKTDADKYVDEIESYTRQLQFVLSKIKPQKTCYALTIYHIHYIFHETDNNAINHAISNYNRTLYDLSQTYSNLKIIDFTQFCKLYPVSDLIDWKYYYLAQMQLNPKLSDDFNRWIQNEIAAIEGRRKKCITLDLDNTLWGGIVGEDGIDGIQIGNTYPGSAFLDFQNNLLELAKRGVILTVCSKNNEQDVLDAWDKNPYLQIKKEHLAAWRINWKNKAENIAELAQELNIGLDSIVFIDDNPAERAFVKQMYPMVETPEFPKQPYRLPAYFESICRDYFQIYRLTDEDTTKQEQYKANAERIAFQNSFTSFDDFLMSLDIELTIDELNPMNLPRIAQLTQKTNQFNLTTKRYTEEEISGLAAEGAKVYGMHVKDKFGDHGITGVAIITTDERTRTATIDSFLLSCRILGKHIENAFLKYCVLQLKNQGYSQLNATYIPTLKNSQVSDFYDLNGFNLTATDANGTKNYHCHVHDFDFTISTLHKINS